MDPPTAVNGCRQRNARSSNSGRSSRRSLTRNQKKSKGKQKLSASSSASVSSSSGSGSSFPVEFSTTCTSSADVVKEIRSSLCVATSIIEGDHDNNTPDDYSTTTTGTSVAATNGYPITKSTIRFECGRLKYSHVKEEWSIRHKPIVSITSSQNDESTTALNSSTSSPLLQHYNSKTIASIWPVSKQCDIQATSTTNGQNSSSNDNNNNHNYNHNHISNGTTTITRKSPRRHNLLVGNEKQQLNNRSCSTGGDERIRIKSIKRQNPRRKRKKCSSGSDDDEDEIVVNTVGNDDSDDDDINNVKLNGVQQKATTGMIYTPSSSSSTTIAAAAAALHNNRPVSPPLELVRCLLHGAEFISTMICARIEMDCSIYSSSEYNNKNGIKVIRGDSDDNNLILNNTSIASSHSSEIQFWSRRTTKNSKHVSSNNLQSMLVAIAEASIRNKNSPDFVEDSDRNNIDHSILQLILHKLIGECIQFAQTYTLNLIAPWESSWQTRIVFLSENMVDNENHLSSTVENVPKRKIERRRNQSRKGRRVSDNDSDECNGISKKQNNASISFDTTSFMQDFVKACLAQPSQDARFRQNSMSDDVGITSLMTKAALVNGGDRIEKHHSNNNKKPMLSSSPKRTKRSRRSKDFTIEPADSLAAAATTTTTTNHYIRNRLSLSTEKKESPLKQRPKRRKLSHQFSPPSSPSILENAATVRSQRGSLNRSRQSTLTNSGGKRKSSPISLIETTGNSLRMKEKMKCPKEVPKYNNIDDETHNFINNTKDVENVPSNSLYELFDKNNQQKVNDIPSEIFSVDDGVGTGVDSSSHNSSPKKQEFKDCTVRRSPGRKVRWNGIMMSPLMGPKTRVNRGGILREEGVGQDKICRQHYEHHKKNGYNSPSEISSTQGTVPAAHKSSDKLSVDYTHKSSDKLSVDYKIQSNGQSKVNTRNEYSTRNKSKHPPKMQNDDEPETLDERIEAKVHSENVEGVGLIQERTAEAKEETVHGSTTEVVEEVNHTHVEEIERHEKKNGKSSDKDNSTVKINGEVDKSSQPSPLEKNGSTPSSSSQSQQLKSPPPPPPRSSSRSQSDEQRSGSKSSKKVLSSSLPSKMEQRLAFEKKRGEQQRNNNIKQREQQQQVQHNLQHQQVELQNRKQQQVELQRREHQKLSAVVNLESTKQTKVIDNLPQNSTSNDDRGEQPEVVPPKSDSLRGRRRAAVKCNNSIKSSSSSSSSNNTKGCPPRTNSTPSSSLSSPRLKQKQTEEDTTAAITTTRKRAKRLCSSQHSTNGDNKINGNETNNLSGSTESQVNTRNGDRRYPSRDSRRHIHEEDEEEEDDEEEEQDNSKSNSNSKSPRKPEKNSVRDEERQSKGQIRTGTWTKEETMAFLHGVRIYGFGNWSTIADNIIPTRTTRQVKSKGQTASKGKNCGDYSELDEYLKEHPDFCKNMKTEGVKQQTKSTARTKKKIPQEQIGTKEKRKRRRDSPKNQSKEGEAEEEEGTNRVIVPEYNLQRKDNINSQEGLCNTVDDSNGPKVDVSNWVKLSHLGHVSDYHGYKRKNEHFVPLQYGPIDDIRGQIQRALIENMESNGEENNEEIIQENLEYNNVVQRYDISAERERSQRKKLDTNQTSSPQETKLDVQDNIPVIFSSSNADLTTEKWNPSIFEVDKSNLQPPIDFRFFDEEDDVLVNATNDKTNNGKRPSRTAQIASQKKTSIRILSEMLYSLDFIDKYNSKLREGEVAIEEEEEEEEGEDGDDREEEEEEEEEETEEVQDDEKKNGSDSNKKREGKVSVKKMSGRKARGARCISTSNTKIKKPLVEFNPAFMPLAATALLANYNELQNKNRSFYQLKVRGKSRSIESTKEAIHRILDKSNALQDFLKDEETIAEEKSLGRSIRGYTRKADQEKIEKRNFEEKQKDQQHEYEYYNRKRKKSKKTPQDIEWTEIQSRPFRYKLSEEHIETCKFEPNCPICAPILHDESPSQSKHIFFPGVQRLDDIPVNGEGSTDSNSSPEEQKLSSALKLSELHHTLSFVQRYNNGMIVSSQKRKMR